MHIAMCMIHTYTHVFTHTHTHTCGSTHLELIEPFIMQDVTDRHTHTHIKAHTIPSSQLRQRERERS